MSRRSVSFIAASLMLAGAAVLLPRAREKAAVHLSAVRYDENGVRDRDIEFYSRRIEEDPSSALDRSTLARLLFARGRTTGSTADLSRSEQLVRESIGARTHRNYQSFELLATLLMTRHEFRAARAVAIRLDSLDPDSPSHLALLGEIELELGEYEAAASHFERVNYDGRNFTTGARVARWYELTGQIGKARALLERAIVNVDRRDDLPREQVAWFHYRVGDLEMRAGNLAAADSSFRRALEINPDDARVLGGMARAALARGEWRDAVELGKKAGSVQVDPGIFGTVSVAYTQLGDTAMAASYARAMSESALEVSGAIHRVWGMFVLDHGTDADRTRVLELARAELRDRKDVYGHDLLAWALYRNGQIDEARREMKLALAQNTQDVMLTAHAKAINAAAGTLASAPRASPGS